MKKLLSITLLLLTTLTVKAQTLEATSVTALMDEIKATDFQFKDRGMIFGFQTIQSCLYVSKDIAIIKNYCFPAKPYPARGYTIISKKYGMIDLYEEQMAGVLKRDVMITQFPEILAPYLSTAVPDTTTAGMSSMIEKMYNHYYPGCWSTNYSWDSEEATAACSNVNVLNFDAWAKETQDIVNNEASWFGLMDAIQAKIQ
jgi:hypothetical protein